MTPASQHRLGQGDPCPLCGVTSGVATDRDGYHCLVCGAPRVLLDAKLERRGAEKADLELTRSLRRRRALFAVLGGVAAVATIAALAFAVLAALVFSSSGARLVFAGAALVPFVVSIVAFWQSRKAQARAVTAMSRAEATVAKDVLRSLGPVGAEQLSEWMKIPLERARLLLAGAEVDGLLSPTGPDGTRVRVADENYPPDGSSEPGRKRVN